MSVYKSVIYLIIIVYILIWLIKKSEVKNYKLLLIFSSFLNSLLINDYLFIS